MYRDLRMFGQKEKQTAKEPPKASAQKQQQGGEYEKIIDQYKDMDSNSLMNELYTKASELKAQGKLDASTLENLNSTLAPMLDDSQKEALSSILKTLK